ncbi:MAG: tRNA (guanosine(37)-N1)-methyltransferase TrmD [Deltaproteobacteria bacterium]|jgi:tRNA (guanine37-N1)-methyltransferase|nr:tRNA (guanosine(37)-N1)-methyltransferase TrmD [Deltaproteobacteria bacterium]
MIFEVLTLFPDIFKSFLAESLLAKALAKGLVSVELVNIRDFAHDRHRTADDRPYGGGPGMVLKAEPVALALESLLSSGGPRPLVINLTPSGRLLDQALVRRLSGERRLILICGRYEGIDQRVLDRFVDLELSVGDYVLNGGEVPAMAIMEAVSRLIPGFLGRPESSEDESHSYGLLEYPLYTRPRQWRGLEVPGILLSGHHAQVAAFRLAEAVGKTRSIRPELLEDPGLVERVAEVLGAQGSAMGPRARKSPRPSSQSPIPPGRSGGEHMPHKEINGKTFPVDDEGFLLDHGLWDEDWVMIVAGEEEIEELTDDHRAVLESLRAYRDEHGLPPRVRDMTQVTGFKMKYIYEMFPSGPGKGACKMAGLSKPEGCV